MNKICYSNIHLLCQPSSILSLTTHSSSTASGSCYLGLHCYPPQYKYLSKGLIFQQLRFKGFNPRKAANKRQKALEREEAINARINENITQEYDIEEVTLLRLDGSVAHGVQLRTALEEARAANQDLVLLREEPPTCKIMNAVQYREKHLATKQGIKDKLKEVMINENITEWDLKRKVENVQKFLTSLYRVKIIVNFKRELNEQFGYALLSNITQRVKPFVGLIQNASSVNKKEVFALLNPDIKAIKKMEKEGKLVISPQPEGDMDVSEQIEKQKPDIDEDVALLEMNQDIQEHLNAEKISPQQLKKYQQMAMKRVKKMDREAAKEDHDYFDNR